MGVEHEELKEDEFGADGVFNDKRLASLKSKANVSYKTMTEIVVEIAELSSQVSEKARSFYAASKEYAKALVSIEHELEKPKF